MEPVRVVVALQRASPRTRGGYLLSALCLSLSLICQSLGPPRVMGFGDDYAALSAQLSSLVGQRTTTMDALRNVDHAVGLEVTRDILNVLGPALNEQQRVFNAAELQAETSPARQDTTPLEDRSIAAGLLL